MYYYDVHVEIPKSGYSFGVECDEALNDEEVVELALQQQKFEESGDHYNVDSVETITESEYNSLYKH